MALLDAQGVESGYGDLQILWGIDLNVEPRETVILLGANSAGKTTLLRTIVGLLPCRAGSITFEGERIEELSPNQRIRRGIAFMSELGVLPTLSIEENILLGGYFLSGAEIRRRSAGMYELFSDLAKKRHQLAASLSGGQRKMLGIAKALVSQPKLLLMDEPSSGLAPVFVKQLFEVLQTAIVGGTALLLAEQNVAFLRLADRGYLIDNGRVRVSGTRAELEASDAVHAAYFGL
ncbi:MAG: ABC transporter ATP-binding protein [Candidatus Aquilonibacter sp.]